LQRISEASDFWDDSQQAQKIMQEISTLKEWSADWKVANKAANDADAMLDLAEESKDESLESDIDIEIKNADELISALEVKNLLSGKDDESAAYLTIHSGAGGTEACDWAEMLLRMYSRWAERHKYKVFLVDELEGDVAGIKSATIEIAGKYAYGYLKAESGVHRLVRISPFDSNARRHTSFA
jgi:peptide chain release factor 2